MPPIPHHTEDTWVLVCNGGQAKMFVNHGPKDSLHEMDAESMPIPKIGDLVTGSRGRSQPPGDMAQSQTFVHPDPRRQQKEDFLKRVANAVNDNAANIPRLIVVAPAKALHVLREELSPKVQQKIISEISKDLTKSDERTLPQFLQDHMNLSDPIHEFDEQRSRIYAATD